MPEGTTLAPDRKPCGCLRSVECTHRNPPEGSDAPETKFDASKFLREPPSVELTLSERGSRYGDFRDNAALSQQLEETCRHYRGFENLNRTHREALKFIFQKISRIVNGDPNYADNWHDIQGYAKLVEDRLPKGPK